MPWTVVGWQVLSEGNSTDLPHITVEHRSSARGLSRGGRGNPKVRAVEDRVAHGTSLRAELEQALTSLDSDRVSAAMSVDELLSLGSILTIEGYEGYPLKLDSLQQVSAHRTSKRPKWLLLSVSPSSADESERAVVWVADEYRSSFTKLFTSYIEKSTPKGNPANNGLVANMSRIRRTVLSDLWQSSGEPQTVGSTWWELWLRAEDGNVESLRAFCDLHRVELLDRAIFIGDRLVTWVNAHWEQLQTMPFTSVPLSEIRRPEFIDTIEDLSIDEQDEYTEDLAQRIVAANESAPAVCLLDTGVLRSHVLLVDSLGEADLHTVVGSVGFVPGESHGTQMAGLALFGSLDSLLVGSSLAELRHRLESVRMGAAASEPATDPCAYADVTIQAVAKPEIASNRKRVYCLSLSAPPDRPGEPTLWSASVDALASGVDVVSRDNQIELLGLPVDDAKRLILVAGGNVDEYKIDHLDVSDTSTIEDPAQSWNALTVSAHTALSDLPTDAQYAGWRTVAESGELSPHSRTSLLFGTRPWPIKPDICMEGGNTLSDGQGLFETKHPAVSLRTTHSRNDSALASANATSAATAAASRLAALVVAQYPSYWPETVRGLLVHRAEWTPAMRKEIDAQPTKALKQLRLRRYGWGVPTEASTMWSSAQSVSMIVQDSFVPFAGSDFKMNELRLHTLPWPSEQLSDLGAADVSLRITLSYFVEPTASRRGWREKYSYASHALRFDLQGPLESEAGFLARVNRQAASDESGHTNSTESNIDWMIGPNARNLGSLHQDVWETSGAALAQCGRIAVYPVGGWWKRNKRKDRMDRPVRYSLIVSLRTAEQSADLYAPIAVEMGLAAPTLVEIEGG